MQHVDIPTGHIHQPHNWEFADAAERAASPITDADLIGRLALQIDNGTFWRLTGVSPAAWQSITIAHESASDPHPQYTTPAEAAAAAPVQSVAGRTGSVTLDLSDISGAGTAAALDAPATGDATSGQVVKGSDSRLSDARTPTAHSHAISDITGLATQLASKENAGAVAAHESAPDPHPQYTTAAEASAAAPVQSVAGRTGSVTLSTSDVSGLGTVATLDVPSSGNASSTQAVKGDDTRLSDSRTPTAHTHSLSGLTQSGAGDGQVAAWSNAGGAWMPTTIFGLPAGGSTNQVLQKLSAADGHVGWVTPSSGGADTTYSISGTTPALSPANGTIQIWTLTGNSTPTAGTWNEGESITLMVDDGTAYTVTWFSVTWVGGVAPTLATTGYTIIELWKVGSTIYGCLVGSA